MLHFDGAVWREVPSGVRTTINDLWTDAHGTVLAAAGNYIGGGNATYDGTVLRWSGSAWLPDDVPNVPSLTSIWGANADDIWAVGDYGTFVHSDGTSWSEVPGAASTHDTFLGVWGQDAEHVWAVGTHGYINFYDGSSWHQEQAPAHRTLYDVGGNSDGVWALGANGALLFKPSR